MDNKQKDIEGRARWLYLDKYGCGIEDMKKCVRQAITDLDAGTTMTQLCAMYDITYDDYIDTTARGLLSTL